MSKTPSPQPSDWLKQFAEEKVAGLIDSDQGRVRFRNALQTWITDHTTGDLPLPFNGKTAYDRVVRHFRESGTPPGTEIIRLRDCYVNPLAKPDTRAPDWQKTDLVVCRVVEFDFLRTPQRLETLALDECYVVLLAVRDCLLPPEERLVPPPGYSVEQWREGRHSGELRERYEADRRLGQEIAYAALFEEAKELAQGSPEKIDRDKRELNMCLRRVRRDLEKHPVGDEGEGGDTRDHRKNLASEKAGTGKASAEETEPQAAAGGNFPPPRKRDEDKYEELLQAADGEPEVTLSRLADLLGISRKTLLNWRAVAEVHKSYPELAAHMPAKERHKGAKIDLRRAAEVFKAAGFIS